MRARHAAAGRSLTATAAACLALLAACEGEPTGVDLVTVRVSPDTSEVVAGEDLRLDAQVLDHLGQPRADAIPRWSSTDTSIATVDASGVVRGRAEGWTDVHASFGGASDAARVRVLPHPSIAVSERAVTMAVGAGGPAPRPRTISIRNGGAGSLSSLDLEVRYPTDSPRWLEAELAGTAAPTTVEVAAAIEGLEVAVYEATVVVTSASAGVEPIEVPVTLTLTDFSIHETDAATVVREDAGADSLRVVLDSPPSTDVVIAVSSDGTAATASPSELRFTPEDWATPRIVAVSAKDDPAVDGDEVSLVTLAIDAAASDSAFHGIPAKTVEVTTLDDDHAGLFVGETGGVTLVAEHGTTDELTVTLAAQPLSPVVLSVSSDDPGEATVAPSVLTFAPADWSTPQVVTVKGVDDPVLDGDRTSDISIAVRPALSDDAFDALPATTVTVTTRDDDRAGLVVDESGGITVVDERGMTDDVSVSLAARPLANVVVTVTGDTPSEATAAPPVLTFTPADWRTPQVVTVAGVDDGVTDGGRTSTLTLSIDASASDDAFDAVADVTVLVTTLDGDFIGVSTSTPTGHPGVPSNALVASYDMTTLTATGLLQDFSGRGLDGIISGTVVEPSPRGGARVFDAATDRIELPARSDFDLDGPLTLVARIRMDRQRQHQHILACDDKFAFAVREADQVRLSNSRGDLAETVSPLPGGVWHSVIGVFRGTAGDVLDDTNIEIWIDGVRVPVRILSWSGSSPAVWRDGVLHATDACYIGFESHQGDPSHQNLAFYGAIDEVVVFGRALTPQEIQLLSQSP